MLVSHLLAIVIAIAADPTPSVSSFSDGPLRITGNQLVTSIVNSEGEVPRWQCQATGAAMVRFGDITASADGIGVSQIDAHRYRFELKGKAGMHARGVSANAAQISWTMDDRPMVLAGHASLTVVIDGNPTTVAADKMSFDHKNNSVKLPDGSVKRLPSPKIQSLRQ